MSHQVKNAGEGMEQFRQWCFQETVKLERKKKDFDKEKREFEEEKRSFERERKEFYFKRETEERRLEQKERLLDMKRDILETELKKLAGERDQLEREKHFYQEAQNRCGAGGNDLAVNAELFFKGVGNELALKKRYKDLIKIYHPDNLAGDTKALQEINREYDVLKKRLG